MELKTKTQIIFCCLNENLTTFLYTLTSWPFDRGNKKTKVYTKVECYFQKNWVLVFSFMYLVLVDVKDRSLVTYFLDKIYKFLPQWSELVLVKCFYDPIDQLGNLIKVHKTTKIMLISHRKCISNNMHPPVVQRCINC